VRPRDEKDDASASTTFKVGLKVGSCADEAPPYRRTDIEDFEREMVDTLVGQEV
jgi:hypothetical protein